MARLSLLFLLLLPSLAAAQPQAPPPPQAPPIGADAQAALAIAKVQTGLVAKSYSEAYQSALRRKLPLVIFVGGMERHIPGCETVAIKTLTGYPERCVVVSVPAGDYLAWRATLPATATNAEISKALTEVRRVEQSTSPAPFRGVIRSSGGNC